MFEDEPDQTRGPEEEAADCHTLEVPVAMSPGAGTGAGGGAGEGGALPFTDEAMSILTSSSLLARSLLGHSTTVKRKECLPSSIRRKREFIPVDKKDEGYWDKRRKNNEAAKRSREKRRVNDMVLESRVLALLEENARLRAELLALKFRFGLVKDPSNAPILPLTATPHPPAQSVASQYYLLNPSSSHTGSSHVGQVSAHGCRDAGNQSEDSGFSTPGGSSVGSPVFFEDHGKLSPHRTEELSYDLYHSPPDIHLSATKLDHADTMKNLPHKLRFKMPGNGDGGNGAADSRCSPATLAPVGREGQRDIIRGQGETGDGGSWFQQLEAGDEGRRGGGQSPQYKLSSAQRQTDIQHENSYLKSQLTSLSVEVAQLKKLFTEQLMSNSSCGQTLSQ